MTQLLKQAVEVTIPIGPFVDSTDGDTEETGLTIAQADVRLSKNGGTFAQKSDSSTSAHMEKGMYACTLGANDVGSPGRLRVYVHVTGALPWWQDFMVVGDGIFPEYLRRNTMQSGSTSTTAVLDTGASTTDDFYNGGTIYIVGGTGAGQMPRVIPDYVGSSRTADVVPAWTTTPDSTSVFEIYRGVSPEASIAAVQTTANTINTKLGTPSADIATDVAVVDTVVDSVLASLTSTLAEGTSVPAANASMQDKVNYIFAHLRNPSTFDRATGAWALRNDANTANIATRTDSIVGDVYTKAKDT